MIGRFRLRKIRMSFEEARTWAIVVVLLAVVAVLVASRTASAVDLALGLLVGSLTAHALWLAAQRRRPDDSVDAVKAAIDALGAMANKGSAYTLLVTPRDGGVAVDSHYHPGGDVSRAHVVQILRGAADELEAEHVSSERLN